MWTPATREQHSRSELRYSTDLTDAEWAIIEPLLPSANPLGRPRLWSLREIVNGIFFVLRGGVPWRLLPKDLPPKSTVYGYFSAWREDGLFAGIRRVVRVRRPSPTRCELHVEGGSTDLQPNADLIRRDHLAYFLRINRELDIGLNKLMRYAIYIF